MDAWIDAWMDGVSDEGLNKNSGTGGMGLDCNPSML